MEPPSTPPPRINAPSEVHEGGKAGPQGEAFSFPVTPTAVAPVAADAAFGAWPSFRKKRRQVPQVRHSAAQTVCPRDSAQGLGFRL